MRFLPIFEGEGPTGFLPIFEGVEGVYPGRGELYSGCKNFGERVHFYITHLTKLSACIY